MSYILFINYQYYLFINYQYYLFINHQYYLFINHQYYLLNINIIFYVYIYLYIFRYKYYNKIIKYIMCSVNHEKKAIFIHIPKTAGIYIRSSLEKYYGFETFLCNRDDHIEYCSTNINLNKDKPLTFCNNKSILQYYKTSKQLTNMMDLNDEKWKDYYKFCFARNPYSRIVSGWNYIQETEKLNIDFDVYLTYKNIVNENEYSHVFLPQSEHIYDENQNYFMNYVGEFENLENEFKTILSNIGFNEKEINHDTTNKNKREHGSYKKYYSQESLNIVNEIYKKDFNKLKYPKINNIENL
jgi:hypothetical protein